jgi:hypothetical protein
MSSPPKLERNPTWEAVREYVKAHTTMSDSGCWEWNGALTEQGYGRCFGRLAHRLSYEAWTGPIGGGLDIDHLCRNRACVNPAHLEPVTRRENLARGIGVILQKQRAAERRFCSRGHELTEGNTYIRPSDGVRQCRECRRAYDIATRMANKDSINARKRDWRRQWKEKGIRK